MDNNKSLKAVQASAPPELTASEQQFLEEIKGLIQNGQRSALAAVNYAAISTYWNIGKRIVEKELSGNDRAEYGKHIVEMLADGLTGDYGTNYSKRNLWYYRKLYEFFPDFEIVNACVHNLSWTHFRALLRVDDENARIWYLKEASDEGWNTRTLDRNIATQYYFRLLQAPKKETVIAEMKGKTAAFQKTGYELVKSPVIAEFLGFKNEE